MRTDERILDTAMAAFGTRGYEATSLDDLAAELGIRKQTILYWYPSKDALLGAVIDRVALELMQRVDRVLRTDTSGLDRIDEVVKAMFRMAARHPAMLGMFRELNRLGPPASTRLTAAAAPLLKAAVSWLEAEMDAGHLRRHDPQLLVLLAYSAVTGLASDVEVLRALGEQPTLSTLIRRRDSLLALLHSALEP